MHSVLGPKCWMECPALKEVNEDDQINYEDIFSDDKLKVKGVTKILIRKFAKFVNLKATVHGSLPRQGPVLLNQKT